MERDLVEEHRPGWSNIVRVLKNQKHIEIWERMKSLVTAPERAISMQFKTRAGALMTCKGTDSTWQLGS